MREVNRIVGTLALAFVVLALGVAPASAGKVEIIRDDYGVPHVYGANWKSTWYGVGYAMAQDRLWQADLHRRTGTGRLAELLGPSALEGDVGARLLFGNPEKRKALLKTVKPATKKALKWYVRGINAWIEEATATGQLPIEYTALELGPPEPFTVDDTIAFSMAFFYRFGENGADELDHLDDLQQFVARHGAAEGGNIFADTHIPNDPTAPTTIPPGEGAGSAAAAPALNAEAILDSMPSFDAGYAAAKVRSALAGFEKNSRRIGLHGSPASNAVAIGPELSKSGRPLLLHGPQMGHSTPQINHEIGIHGGGMDVTGMSIAGGPLGVAIGVSKKHAWTLTSGITDNSDLYLESVSSSDPTQYFFAGSARSFDCRQETFQIRGAANHQQVICETVHGPVVAQIPGVAISLRTAAQGGQLLSIEAVHEAQMARNVRAFGRALSKAAVNFNVLYADVKGNIAYWHVGKIPIRAAGDSPFFPHIGAGIAEWQGFIPWNQMPHVKNPAQGYLVNWNNKPQISWPSTTRGFGQWGPVARVRTLMNLVGALPKGSVKPETVAQINLLAGHTTDTPSGNQSTVVVSTLLPAMLGHVDTGADARLPAVVGMLSSWNTLQIDLDVDGRYDHPAVAVFNTWWPSLINRVFADELGSRMERNVVANMAGRMLIPGPIPLFHDYLDGESVGGAVTGALISALDSLTASYGSEDMSTWQQPDPMISWPAIGAAAVPDTPWQNRGTYNQITRLGRGSGMKAMNVIAPGQSGSPFSSHFADQLLNYATWNYKKMRLTRASQMNNAESVVVLNATK